MKIKKIIATILSILAIIGTYIGVNQLTDRSGHSDNQNKDEYGLGLPKSSGVGAATRNSEK